MKVYDATERAYKNGFAAGERHTLETLKEKIHLAAEVSGVNKYEAQYINQVVMLSTVDKVIDELLQATKAN